jgi:DNA-directed RNA polymerase
MNDKEFTDSIHILIHSVRLLPNYKPSDLERRISRLVIQRFSDSCSECKEVGDKIKNEPVKKGFLNKLGEVLNND